MKIIKSKRKTISIEITSDAEVVVRAPKRMSDKAIRAFVEEKRSFIDKNIDKMKERKESLANIRTITDIELKELLVQAKRVIPDRVKYYAPLVGVEYGRITIRNQRTRWGSCSAKGNLNFNVALMRVPLEVLDYVVVHELCHRLEMNHSSRFWDNVEKVIPEYKTYKKWLRDNGDKVMKEFICIYYIACSMWRWVYELGLITSNMYVCPLYLYTPAKQHFAVVPVPVFPIHRYFLVFNSLFP